MFRFHILCFVLCLCTVNYVRSETARFSYNSSDISYLSNGIQFPIAPLDLHSNGPLLDESSQEYLPEMKWLSELYNHLKWRNFLKILNNTKCQEDLSTYIDELHNGTSWATKIYDASGRYSGQFFFGNDYWLGSRTLCRELQDPDNNIEVPPYPMSFYVVKVRININGRLTPVTRQLNVGECLPASCSVTDVRLLFAQERHKGTTISLVGIRKVPGGYSVLLDGKFQLLAGICLIVAVVILVASIVEIMLIRKSRKPNRDLETQNNNNVDDSRSVKGNNNKPASEGDHHKKECNKQGILLKILLAFSALNNIRKIVNVDALPKESVKCIHGLRFFSIAWIIMVHTYLEVFAIADNKTVRTLTERKFMYQTISNATFSVDTFFFISGLLVTITYFRSAAKKTPIKDEKLCQSFKKNFLRFWMLVIYRFFRLTPVYLFVLGVNEIILRYLHDYSVFSPAIIDHISCENYWWRNALYINNFFPASEYCMLWSWYISNDTQFYVIAVVLLLIGVKGTKHLKFAGGALGVFLVASWITTFVIAMKYNYTVRIEEPFALLSQLYDKPWMRIGPYLVGMMAGYLLFKVGREMKLSPLIVTLGWTLSLSCLASLVYGVGKHGLAPPVSAFYAALGHTAWGLSLAWITVACSTGHGGLLARLFEFRLFLPLSRLTYCAYLVHPVFMCFSSFLLDGPLHLQEMLVVVIYCGNLIFSFGIAFVISVSFEAPVVNLLKMIF